MQVQHQNLHDVLGRGNCSFKLHFAPPKHLQGYTPFTQFRGSNYPPLLPCRCQHCTDNHVSPIAQVVISPGLFEQRDSIGPRLLVPPIHPFHKSPFMCQYVLQQCGQDGISGFALLHTDQELFCGSCTNSSVDSLCIVPSPPYFPNKLVRENYEECACSNRVQAMPEINTAPFC